MSQKCSFISINDGEETETIRNLNAHHILVRQSKAIPIINKVLSFNENNGKTLSSVISSRKPFGIPTNYTPMQSGISCWFIQRIGKQFARKEDVVDDKSILNKWKLLIPKAPIAEQTEFSKPVRFYYDGNPYSKTK